MKQIIHNNAEMIAFMSGLSSRNEYPISINYDFGVKRSLPANAQQHVWYKAISDYTGEDVKTSGNRMKRDIGLPILLTGEYGEKVSWMLDKIDFYSRSDNQQVSMIDLIPVTSLFTSKMHTLYRDNMQAFWREQGLNLEYING